MLKEFHKIATTDELADGDMKTVTIGMDDILLARIGDEYYAIDNICNHAGAYLDMGKLNASVFEIQCPLHGGAFDIRSGEAIADPCYFPAVTFAVRIEEGDILVGPK